MILTPADQLTVDSRLLAGDERFPNNPQLPLLLLRQAFSPQGDRAAMELKQRFAENGWGGGWRNGVYGFHHFHSNAHEVLGFCTGRAEIQFGGPSGPVLAVEAGDVAILPAGTAHRKVEATNDLLVVGAYPAGQEDYDLLRGDSGERPAADQRIAAVPMPERGPLYGTDGPLCEHWTRFGEQLCARAGSGR